MNIVWVNHYASRPTTGIGGRHYMLAKELMRKGHTVTIIASSFRHNVGTDEISAEGQMWKNEILDGVPFVWIKTSPYKGNGLDRIWNMLCFSYRVAAWTDEFNIGIPDVVIGSSPHPFAAVAASVIARRYRVPFVLEVRDLWPESLIEIGGMSPRNPGIWVLERIEKYLYKAADQIVTLLPGAVDHICQKGGVAEIVTWIPNGIDIALVPYTPPPNEAQFTVMYAGAHGLANGLDSILDAAAILQCGDSSGKVRFVFIGDGPEKERLRARVKEEGLSIVSFEPYVPRTMIFEKLQEASIFIATLRNIDLYKYGISLNKLYDYLACARPVVFGAKSINNPVEESGGGITVPPEDAEAMAKAVIDIMNMPYEERVKMGLKGREYVGKHNDYGKLADRLEQVIYKAFNGSNENR